MKKPSKGLSQSEIADLDRAFIELFRLHHELRTKMPIAKRIKFPSVPSVLSESMVILASRKLFELEGSWSAFRGGKACDVLLRDDAMNQQRVEVKATGSKGTLEIKERDINTDWLVWLAIGSRYDVGHGPINIYVLHYPYNHLNPDDATNRITNLSKFLEKVGETGDLSKFQFASLEEFFHVTQ